MKNYIHPLQEEYDLSTFNFFKSLTPDELKTLDGQISASQYKKGDVIYHEGKRLTGFYCIMSGVLKVIKTGSDGKEQIIRFVTKGDIIAYRSLLSKEGACTTAKVIEQAVLVHVPYNTLTSILSSNHKFTLNTLQVVCKELKDANNYITDIAHKTVRERVAEVLIMLRDKFGVNKDNVLQVSLTREEIANMVGTATESVIRLLSEFKHDKIIEIKGREIKFVNLPRLTRIANM
ncbi:Crp/Fnr family transcriptional regulator [Prolixibacteraceae bacterium]|nr:Crp/Fnr family transcriptional regulator [Prolixibacteraceae bacterium]